LTAQIDEGREDVPEVVSAHEIATFVFCPEQWRLEYGLGLEPGNRASLESGRAHHARKRAAERAAGRLLRIGRGLGAAALIALFVLWILVR
jgi:hypothetical protein